MARFYGWSDTDLMRTPWRRVLAYAAHIAALQAEEHIAWLMLQHGDPPKVLRQLRQQLTPATPTKATGQTDGVLMEWLTNPYLRQNIEILETLPNPTPPTA